MTSNVKMLNGSKSAAELADEMQDRAKGEQLDRGPFDGFDPTCLTDSELNQRESSPKYLIDRCLLAGQTGIVAGPEKALKTSLSVELALSVAYGKPFLNHYKVLETGHVGIFSCERGFDSLKDLQCTIAEGKQIESFDDQLFWSVDPPNLTNDRHIERLRYLIRMHDWKLLILDPYYWMIPGLANQSNNVYAIGQIAKELITLAQDTGCTILVVAHFRKLSPEEKRAKPELPWISGAGPREFARQWLLINRRKDFKPGTGEPHNLWVSIGNQEGSNEGFNLLVDEGTDTARDWNLTIKSLSDVTEEKNAEDNKTQMDRIEKIVNVLTNHPDGLTKSAIKDKVGGSVKTVQKDLEEAERKGLVKQVKIKVSNRKNLQDGWALV